MKREGIHCRQQRITNLGRYWTDLKHIVLHRHSVWIRDRYGQRRRVECSLVIMKRS